MAEKVHVRRGADRIVSAAPLLWTDTIRPDNEGSSVEEWLLGALVGGLIGLDKHLQAQAPPACRAHQEPVTFELGQGIAEAVVVDPELAADGGAGHGTISIVLGEQIQDTFLKLA